LGQADERCAIELIGHNVGERESDPDQNVPGGGAPTFAVGCRIDLPPEVDDPTRMMKWRFLSKNGPCCDSGDISTMEMPNRK
jgi:hypothetical protein